MVCGVSSRDGDNLWKRILNTPTIYYPALCDLSKGTSGTNKVLLYGPLRVVIFGSTMKGTHVKGTNDDEVRKSDQRTKSSVIWEQATIIVYEFRYYQFDGEE